MMLQLEVVLDVRSDFHVGTGAGLGSVLDATVVRDRFGRPIVPGSTIKGLARDAARLLTTMHPALDHGGALDRVFGRPGSPPSLVRFGQAVAKGAAPLAVVHGRSARDRQSGRAADELLFRIEDAGAGRFVANVSADSALTEHEIVLLIAALRRIELLGGQGRRGKGQVSVEVQVKDGPPEWKDVCVPGNATRFESAVRDLLAGALPTAKPTAAGVDERTSADAETSASSSSVPDEAWDTLIVFARSSEPLVLGGGPETGNRSRSLDYIPGTSVRGAVTTWLLQNGWNPEDGPFVDGIVREQLRFGPLLPTRVEGGYPRSLPVPASRSMLTCKVHRGIRGTALNAHGIVDVLLADDPLVPCGVCDAALVPLGGFIQLETRPPERHVLHRVDTGVQVSVHTAIDENTQRAEDQKLYAHEQLAEATWFAGFLWGRSAFLARVREVLDRADGVPISVGKARTRGRGELRLFLREPENGTDPVFPALRARSASTPMTQSFTLTLYSDLIALDPLLRPVTRLGELELWTLLGGRDTPPFRAVRGYAATRVVPGFNGVPGRPRTVDVAVLAGSCFAFEWTETGRRREEAKRLLRVAEAEGIGVRRGEGFGRFLVDFALHYALPDQTRTIDAGTDPAPEGREHLSSDVGSMMETWIPSLPPDPVPQGPARRRVHVVSDDVKQRLLRIPSADRVGLARFLLYASATGNPLAILEAVKDKRAARKGQEADRFLQWLCQELEADRADRGMLQACAVALDRADTIARRERPGAAGSDGHA